MPEKASASSARVSTWRRSPRGAVCSRPYSTTGRLQSRSLPPALSRPSSIQLRVLVNRIEAYLDSDGGERKGGISLDNLIRPTTPRPGVQVDTPSILLDYGILLDRWRREVIEFLPAAVLPLGAGRYHLNHENRFQDGVLVPTHRGASHRQIRITY